MVSTAAAKKLLGVVEAALTDALCFLFGGMGARPTAKRDKGGRKDVGVVTPQATGSAITYAKRYALAAMANLAQTDEDDDGEAAMGRPAEPQEEHVAPFDLADFGDKAGLPDTEDNSSLAYPDAVEERLTRSLEACSTTADLKRWESEHRATLAQMDAAATERLRVVYAKTKNKGG